MGWKKSPGIILLAILGIAGLLYAIIEYYQIDTTRCWQCGRCVVVCPTQAIQMDTTSYVLQIDPELCNGCGLCVDACPHGAIYPVTGNADNNNATLPLRLKCYPNPVTDHTAFSFPLPKSGEKTRIIITNVKGQTVKIIQLGKTTSAGWDCTGMSGRRVPDGIYIGTLINGQDKTSVKITKVH